MADLKKVIEDAKSRVAAMLKEDREEMWRKQRDSFVRSMTTPCEHGELDFEQCAKCRQEGGHD
ncbi:hypothetical protein [Agrobacterium tumefaciens]|uniref:hypothetical protein n=1 Tax=Agrobacterium tumefaciens TaxID=358 RepID=UPI0015742581|nr:hypothetical protein [Agrobacterium tumefaciens]NTB01584.1 hypothetical protein [Agrobacterium tumefaciens]